MKCPKCGYISFDYNEVCPKCNKGIANERDKMKFPSFKPDPPSLLGTLTGKAKKTGDVDLMETPDTAELLDRELDFSTEDLAFKDEEAPATEAAEPVLDDTYSFEVPLEEGLEEVNQESAETFEFSESIEDIDEVEFSTIESDEDLSLDIEEIAIEESEPEPISEASIEDEAGLESDLITIDEEETEEASASELPSFDEETASLELDDLIAAEPGITLEEQEEEVPVEIDETISLEAEEKPLAEPEITLEEPEQEVAFDLDKTVALNLADLPKAEKEISLGEVPEPEGGKEETLLSLEDLKEEEIETIVSDTKVSTDDMSIDQELDLALDEDALSTDEIPISAEPAENGEDFTIDLDSLDLDLELEEPKDKKP